MSSLSGNSAPEYLLDATLGAGGMGIVHLGWLVGPAGKRRVAIKRLASERLSEQAKARIVAEARLVFPLTHANICQVLDLGSNDDGTFIVMEYVAGLDLGLLLRQLKRHDEQLDVASAIYVVKEVARGLDFAHRSRDEHGDALMLVHGDVTPRNILVSSEGEVKLSDFGIARSIDELGPGNELSHRAGTPYFIDPEVATDGLDQRADIYALGVTLYLALGGLPFPAGIDPLRLESVRTNLPSELTNIVENATAPRASRYLSAAALEEALAVVLAARYPRFTPSTLGRVVRKHMPAEASRRSHRHRPLTSMTRADTVTTIVDEPRPELSREGDQVIGQQTKTMPGGRKLKNVVVTGVALTTAVVGIVAFQQRGSRKPQALVTQAQPTTPVAASSDEGHLTEMPTAATTPSVVENRTEPSKKARAKRVGYLDVGANPWGAVLVDGRRVAAQTPAYRLPLPIGSHQVEIVTPDGSRRSRPQRTIVEEGKTNILRFDW